jgi:DNA-binding phage protein
MVTKTGGERYFDERMQEPEYREAYERARDRIRQVDHLIRLLDERRVQLGLSKAELARRAGIKPESVRRLFSSSRRNPTLATLLALAAALGVDVTLVPQQDGSRAA